MKPIVVDTGSHSSKSGFSGDISPKSVIPSKVGRKKTKTSKEIFYGQESFIGQECNEIKELKFLNPIEEGNIINWEDYEKLLHHIFYKELKICPDERPGLFTERHNTYRPSREKLASLLFETFSMPAIYLTPHSKLSLYSVGALDGMVVDSSLQNTRVLPINQGEEFTSYYTESLTGGESVTNSLMEKLSRNFQLPMEIVNEIKEKLCFVKTDDQEICERLYKLPDGKYIPLGNELFESTDILFSKEKESLSQTLLRGILKSIEPSSNVDRIQLWDFHKNILICGGNSMFEGMKSRITREMKKLVPKEIEKELKIEIPIDSNYCAWKGGSVVSSMSTFQSMWFSSDEYNENGPSMIQSKCF
jgi:actin, other eukaryote